MGVTIHFEGRLNLQNYLGLISLATNFAFANNMKYFLFEEENKTLERVEDEEDWDYIGPVKGIKIQPDIDCDPLLEFDNNYYIQEYCKTQFTDIETNLKIVNFLKEIKPLFEPFTVFDEGEYWDTGDIDLLQQHIDSCFTAINEAKVENINLSGPFRLADGRIVDLMEN